MIKLNKLLRLCLLALVLTLFPNQASLSALSENMIDSDLLEFLEEPRPETQTAIEVFTTKDSWSKSLSLFTAIDFTEGPQRVYSHLLFVNNHGKIVKEYYHDGMGFRDPQMINETILVVQKTTAGYLTFWNLETNKQYTIGAISTKEGPQWGHHDAWYNPVTDTFLALGHRDVKKEGYIWEVDTIWEFNWKGELLWEWDMSEWITNYTATQCMVSNHYSLDKFKYSHSNTIFWDSNTNIIYINVRNLDNVWAIEYPTGKVLWRAGRNGNFTMYDKHGNEKISLWWHSHSFYPIPGEPNKFILFDNDLHNGTAEPNIPTNGSWEGGNYHTSMISRLVEVEIDTDTWTMNETWSWEAPPKYYSPIWGSAARIPNGNRVGCFGSRLFRWGKSYDDPPPFPEGGGTLVEVNDTDIVWQLSFPSGWGIYRSYHFQPSLTLNSPEDLTCDCDENDCQIIFWTGKSLFKAYYQITKDGVMLVNKTWSTAKIYYELPSDLRVGTHDYTLTVFDHAGQSVSDTVKVIVKTPTTITVTVYELLAFPVVAGGLTTVGLMLLVKRKKLLAKRSRLDD